MLLHSEREDRVEIRSSDEGGCKVLKREIRYRLALDDHRYHTRWAIMLSRDLEVANVCVPTFATRIDFGDGLVVVFVNFGRRGLHFGS